MDKQLVKKYVSVLNTIIQRETINPSSKDKKIDWNDPTNSWEADNYDYDLKDSQFISFFTNLENQKILKVTGGFHLNDLVEVKGETKTGYDEDGNVAQTDEFVLFYAKVDTKKAKRYKQELEELLTPEDIKEIKNVSKISDEPILKQAGHLNLRASGVICYQNSILDMRTGLKTLCELFIKRPNQLINRDDIVDELGVNSPRVKSTIAKYVSELNRTLEPYFKRQPITNQKKEGWIFVP